MERLKLAVHNRKKSEKASELRKNGFIPGVIYNHGKTDSIKVDSKNIQYLLSHGITESTLIDIDREGTQEVAFIKDRQLHPVRDDLMHIDFYRVTFGEKIKTHIKIHLLGKPAGVKEGGVTEVFLHEVEIETFPRYLVPSLGVDISHLKIGSALHLQDIQFPPDTRILVEGNPIVCMVSVSAKKLSETGGMEEKSIEES